MLTGFLRRIIAKKKRPFYFGKYSDNIDFTRVPDKTGLYIHIPFCRSICSFCPYNKVKYDAGLAHAYAQALFTELQLLKAVLPVRAIDSIYIGGGTPILMLDELTELLAWIRGNIAAASNIGIELHPLEATLPLLRRVKGAGINMVSLGIQSFDDLRLKELGRNYSGSQARAALARTVAMGFDCVDADIMFNLPNQTAADIEQDVSLCLRAGVDQLSAYPLIVFPLTPLGQHLKQLKARRFSSWQEYGILQRIEAVAERLGYCRTSVWTYGREKGPKYTSVTRESFVGVGAGATSQFGNFFYLNTFNVQAYIERVNQGVLPINLVTAMNQREEMAYWLFWRCYENVIDLGRFKQKFGVCLREEFPHIRNLARLTGLAREEGNSFKLTERGMFLYHLIEKHYSTSYLNDMWAASMKQPWLDSFSL